MDNSRTAQVFFVIPSHNEGKSVGQVVARVFETFPYAKVAVINDGSSDDTSTRARRAGAVVIDLPFYCGYGVALHTGLGAHALGLTIPMPVAFLLIAGLGLGSALPSTPGYVGIYQFVAVSVLTPFGFSRTNAIAYILLAQALSYTLVAFWGSLGFWHYRRIAAIPRGATP